MMEHRAEIAKCAQARVSEEFYRLLRAGAARRSMELLVETDLLEILAPELAKGLRPGADDDAEGALRRSRLWAYLGALDRSTERRSTPPTNALILAVLLMPPLRDALDPASNGVRDVGQLVAQALSPALERLRPSRRDSERARQILLAARWLLRGPNRRAQGREFYEEAMRLCEILKDAESLDASLAGRPIVAEGAEAGAGAPSDEGGLDEALPPELESSELGDRGRRRRRGRRGRLREEGTTAPGGGGGPPSRPERGVAQFSPPPALDLEGLLAATRSLTASTARPGFLGSGTFGGPWSSRAE
jgi:poly(A) polymerase